MIGTFMTNLMNAFKNFFINQMKSNNLCLNFKLIIKSVFHQIGIFNSIWLQISNLMHLSHSPLTKTIN